MSGTPARRPRHPRCGVQWVRRGDLTGHCAACCRTFSSVSGFDARQSVATGVLVCSDPDTMLRADGTPWFTCFQDEAGALLWRRCDATPNPYIRTVPAPRASDEDATDDDGDGFQGAELVGSFGKSG